MKLLGTLLLAGIILSVLQAALSVLLVVGLIALIVGVFVRPAETFGLLAFGALANLLQSHPVGAIWVISLMLVVAIVKRDRSSPPQPIDTGRPMPLLPDRASTPPIE